jgi:hypothetical protein
MTSFPNSIQNFPTMQDISAADATLVQQYQEAMEAGNIATATAILGQISNADKKIIRADMLNTITDTSVALQQFYAEKFSNGYVVSATQPAGQAKDDFWFKLGGKLGTTT